MHDVLDVASCGVMSLMQAGRSYSRFSSSRFITQITIHQIHGEGGEATHMCDVRACTGRFPFTAEVRPEGISAR
eukprot:948770-Prymnesium_polylepis.2